MSSSRPFRSPATWRWVWPASGFFIAGVAVVGGWPVLLAVGMVLAVAAVVEQRARNVLDAVPFAALLIVTSAVLMSQVFGAVHVVAYQASARYLLIGLTLVLASCAALVSRSTHRSDPMLAVTVHLPGLAMLALGGFAAARGVATSTGWMIGGDNLRHLGILVRTFDAGNLSYDVQAYPRGWHAFVATVLSVAQPARDPEGLLAALRVQGSLTWLLFAVLVLATATTSGRLAGAAGRTRRTQAVAGFSAGALAMGGSFTADYIAKGFQTSILAATALVIALSETVSRRGDLRPVLASSAAVVLVAHAWQLLLPIAGAIWVVSGFAWIVVREVRTGTRFVALLGLGALVAVSAAPSLLAVAQPSIGVAAAATPGDIAGLPWLWLTIEAMALVGVVALWRCRESVLVSGAFLLTISAALVLAYRLGIPLGEYYPTKMLWTAVVLGLPLLGAASAQLLSALDRRSQVAARAALVAGGVTLGGALIFSMAAPVSSLAGAWNSADVRTVLRTVTVPGAQNAAVVWRVGSPVDDATSQLLLDYFSASPDDPTLTLPVASVEEQCKALNAASRKLVISSRSEAEVTARFACATNVHVIAPVGGLGSNIRSGQQAN